MQPIYVEVSDEITTVIERMKEAEEKSVALVVPKGAILLQSIVNLKLARKAAADTGRDLTLITTDKIGRNLATQLGIPVFNKLDAWNNPHEAGGEESADEPAVIAGVKIHRYYDEKDSSDDSGEEAPEPIEPIVPKQIMKEPKETPPVPEENSKEAQPLTVRPVRTGIPAPTAAAAPAADSATAASPEEGEPDPSHPKHPVSPASSQNHPMKKKSDEKASRRPLIFATYLLILSVLGMAGIAAFFFPYTTLTVQVKPETWSRELTTTASVAASSVSEDNQTVPAEIITGETTSTLTFQGTGKKTVGEKAKGTATIFNGYSSTPQTLPAGAQITASGRTFLTDSAVTVPGARVENGKPVAGSVSVQVTAEAAGAESNLSNATGTVTAPTGSNLYAEIVSTTGGSSREVAVITAGDITNARNSLTETLKAESKNKVKETLGSRDVFFDEAADTFALEEFTTSAAAGTEAESAEAQAKGITRRLVVNKAQVTKALEARLAEGHPENSTVMIDSTTFPTVTIRMDEQVAVITSQSAGRTSVRVPIEELEKQLAGKNRNTGIALVQEQVKGATTSLSQKPGWWPNKNFPPSSRYIRVRVVYE